MRLAWVAGGLAFLVVVALFAWFGRPTAGDLRANAPQPSVWLSDLAPAQPRGFAAPDYRDGPMSAPAAQLAEIARGQRSDGAGSPALTVDTPVESTPPLSVPRDAPQPSEMRSAETALADDTSRAPMTERGPVAPAPVVAEAPPPAETGRLNADQTQGDVRAGLLTSLWPRARPSRAVPVELATLDATVPDGSAIDRSPTPPARPARVSRLASTILASLTAPVDTARAPLVDAPAPNPGITLGANPCGTARSVPRRSGRAPGASTLVAQLDGTAGTARDAVLVEQVLAGNVPGFLRRLVPVRFDGENSAGGPVTVILCVMPDYLAVGSDSDHVRVPLGLPAALRVAERLDMALPTTRIVDAIYAQATTRLAPAPMEPGSQMASTAYFRRHNQTIEGQLRRVGAQTGALIAGHKKDLVISTRLDRSPGRVAIYGWHRTNGRAIQPLSTVHGANYADYSHGIRLISRTAYVNGRAVDLAAVLGDARIAGLISTEGPIRSARLLAAL